MSRSTTVLLVLVAVVLAFCAYTNLHHQGTAAPAHTSPVGKTGTPSHVITGKPTISAAFIDQILCTWHSPACQSGQQLHDLGEHYGIDPAYALAFFLNESSFGTQGMARITHALGNERCLEGYACINTQGDTCQAGESCYAQFPTWAAGFESWYRLIKHGYVEGHINQDIGRQACPCITVGQIIPVYAPASDSNNEQHYIQVVERAVTLWRSGTVALA